MSDAIQLIKEKVNHVDVLQLFGIEYTGGKIACPICGKGTNTPNFSVYDDLNKAHCFTCKFTGDIINFYKAKKSVDTGTAIRELAKEFKIELPKYEVVNTSGPFPYEKYNDPITYDFKETNGELVLFEERWYLKKEFKSDKHEDKPLESKRVWLGHYDQNGTKIYGLKDCIRRILYNRYEVLKASTVFINEGPKCADLINSLGLCGTAVIGGAKSGWRSEYNQDLKDKNVVILQDNDEPGEAFARKVADELYGYAKTTKILLVSPESKGDIEQFIQNGGTKEKLLQMVRDTKKHKVKIEPAKEKISSRNAVPVKAVEIAAPILNNSKQEKILIEENKLIEYAANDEAGDAELLSTLKGRDWVYDCTNKMWMYYHDGVWCPDHKKKARIDSRKALLSQYVSLYSKLLAQMKELELKWPHLVGRMMEKVGSELAELKSKTDLLRSRIKSINKKSRIDNVLELSSSHLGVIYTETFEQHKNLLCLRNGVFDFDKKEFIKHSPAHGLLHKVNINYNPSATCPMWEIFLSKIFNLDMSLIEWISKKVGESLTGYIHEEELLFAYGQGANGKSTFFGVIQMLLNNYYMTIPIEVLLSHSQGTNPEAKHEKAQMYGKRCIVAPEVPDGRKLSESLVKDLTGGFTDMIKGRHLYGNSFEFFPTHKLWIYGNHKPIVRGADNGIWRRLKLIPFNYVFQGEEKKDKHEVMRLFSKELPGILNWAISGYYKEISTEPPAVKSASQEYREESDILSEFLQETLEKDVLSDVLLKDVFQAYLSYCEKNKEAPIAKRPQDLSRLLKERGYHIYAGAHNKYYIKGVKLGDGLSWLT